jgi:hypothetical protein
MIQGYNFEGARVLAKPFMFYLPISWEKGQEILSDVERTVELYQPKIEERTGVSLGNIEVKDYGHVVTDHIKAARCKSKKELEDFPILNAIDGITSFGSWPLLTLERLYKQNYVDMAYSDSKIYVNLGASRKWDLATRANLHFDQQVVHELSHRLWECLGGTLDDLPICANQKTDFVEGFATYCDNIFFRDFYPSGFEINTDKKGKYFRGYRKVLMLAEEHGEGILLQVPSRWKEFDRELENGH